MLKRPIKYTDFDGNEVTETVHFNLTMSELIEMEVAEPGGLKGLLEQIIETNDYHQLVQMFKRIVLAAYGIRDGNRFVKSEELRTQFTQTAAYDALFVDLATNANSGADFVNGVMPPDLVKKAQEQVAKQEAEGGTTATAVRPPLPPTAQ